MHGATRWWGKSHPDLVPWHEYGAIAVEDSLDLARPKTEAGAARAHELKARRGPHHQDSLTAPAPYRSAPLRKPLRCGNAVEGGSGTPRSPVSPLGNSSESQGERA
ncbi:hypothetical protein Stsp01_55270 [Streptomyces sp. NBRC 13847]|nr:hypothetical protein Stsp01_55270 [Streptomyces sp. NBRC 13847]